MKTITIGLKNAIEDWKLKDFLKLPLAFGIEFFLLLLIGLLISIKFSGVLFLTLLLIKTLRHTIF